MQRGRWGDKPFILKYHARVLGRVVRGLFNILGIDSPSIWVRLFSALATILIAGVSVTGIVAVLSNYIQSISYSQLVIGVGIVIFVAVFLLIVTPARIDKEKQDQIDTLATEKDKLLEEKNPRIEIVYVPNDNKYYRVYPGHNQEDHRFKVGIVNNGFETIYDVKATLSRISLPALIDVKTKLRDWSERPETLDPKQEILVTVAVVNFENRSNGLNISTSYGDGNQWYDYGDCTFEITVSAIDRLPVSKKFSLFLFDNESKIAMEAVEG